MGLGVFLQPFLIVEDRLAPVALPGLVVVGVDPGVTRQGGLGFEGLGAVFALEQGGLGLAWFIGMQGVLCPWSPWGGYGGGDPLADPPVTLEGLLGGKVPQAGGALDGLLGSTIFEF